MSAWLFLGLFLAADPTDVAAAPVATPPEAVAPASGLVPAAVGDDELEAMSGGANTVSTILATEQNLTAMNSGNSVNGQTVGSGAITIGSDAFSGFNGIGNFVVNTGHNNNLQGSLSVQVTVLPTPGS